MRDYHDHFFIALYEPEAFGEKSGIVVDDRVKDATAFFQSTEAGDILTLTPSGNAIFGSGRAGVMVPSAVEGVMPELRRQTQTGGQGRLVEIESGHVVGGCLGGGLSINGSAPAYLVFADEGGTIDKVDLSQYALTLTSANPPVAGIDGTTRIELSGANFTPDCQVFIDVDQVVRDWQAGRETDAELDLEAKDVTFAGADTLLITAPSVGIGPFDVVVSNNDGRQIAVKNDAVLLARSDLTLQSGDLLIVDEEADLFDLVPDDEENTDQPGAVFRFSPSAGQMDLVTTGKNLRDPIDLAKDPLTNGYFMFVGGFLFSGIPLLQDGNGGVFSLDPVKGYFNVASNLYAAGSGFDIPQQILFTPGGRTLLLDSGANIYDPNHENIVGSGAIFEVQAAGSLIQYVTTPYWDQPRTFDLGPDGMLYVSDPGDIFFGSPERNWMPGIHRVDIDSGSIELLFRNRSIGFPWDAEFGPDGKLYMISFLGSLLEGPRYDLFKDGWIDGGDLDRVVETQKSHDLLGDFNLDGFTNGLDLMDFGKKWMGPGGMFPALIRIDVNAPGDRAVELLLAKTDLMPTALAFDPSDNLLLIATTATGPASNLYRFNFEDPENPAFLHELPGLKRPHRMVMVR